jgi:8-amino-7-oxononanoate synthase
MFSWMREELRARCRAGLHRTRRRPFSAQGARLCLGGGREVLNFASNDYLNLASDPRLARAAARTALRFGTGAGASPLVTGHLPPLRRLERDLAAWEATEAALVFSSGFVANLALVSTLAGKGDVIFSDALNHASLIDGCRLARATTHVYPHADLAALEALLREHGPAARRRLILSDSLFSMDGDIAPVAGLLDLAERHDAILLLDEAHATGVLGDYGRGATDGVPGRGRLVKVGTLSKALGAQGGFVVGDRTLVHWLVNHARPYIFSTALAPPAASAAREAIGIIRAEPERRQRLLAHAAWLRSELRALGYEVGPSTTQIVPVLVGEADATVHLSHRLQGLGVLVPAIRYPSVPEGTARLRVSLCAGHTAADLERLRDALRLARPQV